MANADETYQHIVLRLGDLIRFGPELTERQIDTIRTSQHAIHDLLSMLKRFADRGHELWDKTDFRDGFKKIPSGDLVDCRALLRQFGITNFSG